MFMIELAPLENGAHRNQTFTGILPDGWAILPDSLSVPSFPFGMAEAEPVNGRLTVTVWNAIPIPQDEETPVPSQLDRLEAQLMYTAMMTDTILEANT